MLKLFTTLDTVPSYHHQDYLHHRSQMLYGLGSWLLWFLISEPVQHLFMMCGVPHQTQHLTVYFILDPLKQIVVIKFRNTFRTLLTASRKIPGHWCLIWSKRYLKSDLLGLIWSHTSDKTAAPQQKSIPRHRWSSPTHPTVAQCVSLFMLYEMETVVLSHLII